MKNLNVTITDDTDHKLAETMRIKHFKNQADAVEWLIQTGFQRVIKEKVRSIKRAGDS